MNKLQIMFLDIVGNFGLDGFLGFRLDVIGNNETHYVTRYSGAWSGISKVNKLPINSTNNQVKSWLLFGYLEALQRTL